MTSFRREIWDARGEVGGKGKDFDMINLEQDKDLKTTKRSFF